MKKPEKASEEIKPAKAPEEPKAPEPVKEEAKAKEVALEPPTDRKALETMIMKNGLDASIDALTKVRVVDLRSLAREYNGEFGIAGREIRNANKKTLIEEFRKYFSK